MSDKPISDLRRRVIADMTVRSFSDKTQQDYIRHIEIFAGFLGRSPGTASGDDIRRFQLAQVKQGAQPPTMNTQASALRFFFTITLGRADLAHQLRLIALSQVDLNVVCCPDQVAPGGYDGGADGQGALADGISKGVPRRDELRGVFVRTALAGRLRLPGVRQWSG